MTEPMPSFDTEANVDTARALCYAFLTRAHHNGILPDEVFCLYTKGLFKHPLTHHIRHSLNVSLVPQVVKFLVEHDGKTATDAEGDQLQAQLRDMILAYINHDDKNPEQGLAQVAFQGVSLPVWVAGERVIVAVPIEDKAKYTTEELFLIYEDTAKATVVAMNDAVTKVQHMRDGENY